MNLPIQVRKKIFKHKMLLTAGL